MNNPLFSIVVVSFNAGELIKTTIESTLKQTYKNYEIIVKDAVSTDNTLSFIPKDDRIKIVVEKDTGIYSGMNRALDFVNGTYIIFMNCGDVFYDENVLEKVALFIEKSTSTLPNVIYGNYYRDGNVRKQPSKLTDFYLYRTPLCHQSVLYLSDTIKEIDGYDEQYKIGADCDLNLKLYFSKVDFAYVDYPICIYLGGGASTTKKGSLIFKKDFNNLRKKYFSKKQRFIFSLKLGLSFTKFRKWCASDKSPRFINRLYIGIINKINK